MQEDDAVSTINEIGEACCPSGSMKYAMYSTEVAGDPLHQIELIWEVEAVTSSHVCMSASWPVV